MKENHIATEHGTVFYWTSDEWDAPCHGKSRAYDVFSFEDTINVILQIMQKTGC